MDTLREIFKTEKPPTIQIEPAKSKLIIPEKGSIKELGVFTEEIWHYIFSLSSLKTLYYLSQVCAPFYFATKLELDFATHFYGYWGFLLFAQRNKHHACANLKLLENDVIEGEGMSTFGANACRIKVIGLRDGNELTATMIYDSKYDKTRSRFATVQFRMAYEASLGEWVMADGSFNETHNDLSHSYSLSYLLMGPVVGVKVTNQFEKEDNYFGFFGDIPTRSLRFPEASARDAFIAKFKAAQVAQQKLLQLLDERRTSPEDVLKALCGKRSFMFTFEQETRVFETTVEENKRGGVISKSKLNGEVIVIKGAILLTFNTRTISISVSFANPKNPLVEEADPNLIIHASGTLTKDKKGIIIGKAVLLQNDNTTKIGTFVCQKI